MKNQRDVCNVKMPNRKLKSKKIFVMLAVILILNFFYINLVRAQEPQQTQLPAYFNPNYGTDPTAIMPWYQEYCNKTGMDFIVMTTPEACEPAVVTSDILEEQDVPVFCRLTAIKINPLIQVPYIKRIDVMTENKSPEILDISFFPARATFSYYDYRTGRQTKEELEGFPSMNNLGYLMIRLKRQPIEAKMPSKVVANLTTRITYDAAKTFGISEHRIVLKKLSDEEWKKDYKRYGFWNGRGFLRLMKLEGTSRAEIALYTSPTTKPLFQGVLAVGEKTKEIKLPFFYCDAGPSIMLEKISKPEAHARIIVNGNELLLGQNDDILDSGCKVSKILPSNFSYAGKVEIKCMGKTETLSIDEAQVELSIEKEKKVYSIGDEIKINNKYFYIGFIGREYESKDGKIEAEDFAILYGGKETPLKEKTRESIATILNEIDRSLKEKGTSIYTLRENEIRNEIISKKSDLKDLIGDVRKVKKITSVQIEGTYVTLTKVIGYADPFYSREVEKAFKEAIEQYTNVAHAYSLIEHPEGSAYGIVSLRKAAELAGFFEKREKQKEILIKIIDKYSDSDNVNILREVDAARVDLAKIVGTGGKTTTILTTPQGNYFLQLLGVERPGLNSVVAHLKVNGTVKDLTESDFIDDNWYIAKIYEDSIELQERWGKKEVLATGDWTFLNETKVELLSTTVNLEAIVVVLPFESARTTEANFSVVIGIEKRLIQLSPEKINSLITSLNKTINSLNSITKNMEKVVATWKKACFVGGTALWIKNFATGLSGESFARKKVMEKWKILCEEKSYRAKLIEENFPGRFDIPISTCYKLKEKEIEKDINIYKEAVKKTNSYILNITKQKDVVSKGGLFGLTQFINEDKFMEIAEKNFPKELENLEIGEKLTCAQANGQWKKECSENETAYEAIDFVQDKKCCVLGKPKTILVKDITPHIKSLYEDGKLYRSQLNDIVLELYLLKECQDRATKEPSIFESSAICKQAEASVFASLKPLYEAAKGPSRQHLARLFPKIEGLDSAYASVSLTELSLREMPVYRANISEIANNLDCPTEAYYYYTIGRTLQGTTLLLLEERGDDTYAIVGGYVFRENMLNCTKRYNLEELGIKNTIIVPIDPRACGNNRIKDPEIKFWEKGYEGMIALMPIIPQSGWYLATQSYTGLEGELVAYKQTGDINTFWICNVGPDGKIDFDFNKGPRGDDAKCCRLISLVTGAEIIIPPLDRAGSKALIERAKECIRNAKQEYDKGKKIIDTGKCGSYKIGKPPTPVPSLECEDFMSPSDCRLLYNLCDPVICPASRCNFGGRYPTENVIAEGIIGSLLLCLPNFDEGRGVLVPICLTGLYNGLDSFTAILKAYRDCLQEQLATGKTIGICDEAHSLYICDFLWHNLGPLLKYGIPEITEPLRGGGEYGSFSDSWKNMIQSLDYFTQIYAPKTIQAFKERSTKQIGKEVCKRFISVVYPSPGKFLEEIAKPEKVPFFWATMKETPNAVTPESHYKVHYIIKAGDTGIYYSIYLRSPPKGGYYEVPEQYFLPPPATGYLPANQVLDETPDFFAPSGYKEICVRINGKDYCDFATVSSSFAVEEIQNFYLKAQIEKEIKTTKECIAGTPSIIPVATLNLQQMLQEGISPALYKRGIIRICSSRDPDEGTNENRYERIGYCDTPEIGCWLDMESVNQTISDLKIRTDVIDYAKQQDYKLTIEQLGLATREQTEANLTPIEQNMISFKEKFHELWTNLKKFEEEENLPQLSKEEKSKKIEEKKTQMKPEIDSIKNKIENDAIELRKIIAKAYDPEMKARAEYRLAELLDLRAKLTGMFEIWEFGIAKKQFCEELNGQWMEPVNGTCPEGYEEVTVPKTELADAKQHPNELCCINITKAAEIEKEEKKEKLFNQWFTDFYKIDKYDTKKKELTALGTKMFSLGYGKIVKIEESGFLFFKSKKYIIQYSNNLFVTYKISSSRIVRESKNLQEGNYVKESEVLAEIATVHVVPDVLMPSEEGAVDISIYISDDLDLKDKEKRNPLCFFTQNILEQVKEANQELIQKNKLKVPIEGTPEYEECQKILKEVEPFFKAPSISAKEFAEGTVDLKKMKSQGYEITQKQIQDYLSEKAPNDSPFKKNPEKYAKWFFENGMRYEIDPAFAVAVAVHESNWGRSDLAKNKNNLFGIKEKGTYKEYKNHEESIKDFYKLIRTKYVDTYKQETPAEIICFVNNKYVPKNFGDHCYCTEEGNKKGCPSWLKNVIRIRGEIQGQTITPLIELQVCAEETKKLLYAADYLKNHPEERGYEGRKWCGEYVWNVYRIAQEKYGLQGINWPKPDPENIVSSERFCCWNKEILNDLKPGDIITFINPEASEEKWAEQSHVMIVGPPVPGKEGKYYVIDTLYYNKDKIEYFPDILDKNNYWKTATWRNSFQKLHRVIPVCRITETKTETKTETETLLIRNVSLVASVNKDPFSRKDRLVNYNDNVTICAVLETPDSRFSSEEVSKNNKLSIKKWQGETFKFTWYEIIPEPNKAYDGNKVRRGEEIITYIQTPIAQDTWCITLKNKEGSYWYRVEVKIRDKNYSSQGTEDDLKGVPNKECGNNEKNYYCGIENVLRISRKSNNSNNFIATIESFKNVPFTGPVHFIRKGGKNYSLTQLYKGMECNTLAAAAFELAYNVQLSWEVHDKIENFIEKFGIQEHNGQKIEKIRINDLLGMGIPIKEGDILFLYNENLQPPAYDHTLIVYKSEDEYLDKDDIVVYTSSGCTEQGSETTKAGMIKIEGNLCYFKMQRFLAKNSPATLIKTPSQVS